MLRRGAMRDWKPRGYGPDFPARFIFHAPQPRDRSPLRGAGVELVAGTLVVRYAARDVFL
jgi:hypothetical protein